MRTGLEVVPYPLYRHKKEAAGGGLAASKTLLTRKTEINLFISNNEASPSVAGALNNVFATVSE